MLGFILLNDVKYNGHNLDLEKKFFELLFQKSQTFILNDDGGELSINLGGDWNEFGLKEKLGKFDVSPDKELGDEWHFEINESSKELIKKAFEANLTRGHSIWGLIGTDFYLKHEEQGDLHCEYEDPEYIIKAQGEVLDEILTFFKKEEIKEITS
ncbi:hypothetical protein J4216_05885 [Candidatus Woesearchaeota archaeon]|nr:hypothetical protein [Candidatus Woesearchaeota archaeon]